MEVASEFTATPPAALSAGAGSAGSSSQRASWNDYQKDHLLRVLYSFPRAHKGGWSKDVWERITEYMNRKFPKSIFSTQQVKQQEKDLHKLYKQVKEILKRPGFQWDTTNCMLEASNSCWIELSQSTGSFSWSRRRIPYYHRLVALYAGCDAEVEASLIVPLQSNSSSTQIEATMDEDDIASLTNSEEAFFSNHGLVPNVPGPEFWVVPSLDCGAINHGFHLNISSNQDFGAMLSPSNSLQNPLTKKPNPQPSPNYIKTQSSDLVENSIQQINEKTTCLSTVFPESQLVPTMENHDCGDLTVLSNPMSRNNPVKPSNIQAFSDLTDHPSSMGNTPFLSARQLISTISSDKPAVFNASIELMENPNSNSTTTPAQMLGNFNSLRQSSPNNPPFSVSSLDKCEKRNPLNNDTDMGQELNLLAPLNQENASNSQQHGKQDSLSNDPEENPVRKIRGKQFRKKKIAKNTDCSMVRCINMFYKLPGFGKSDMVHVVEIFRDELYRQAFVAMKRSHKIFWLKSTISNTKVGRSA